MVSAEFNPQDRARKGISLSIAQGDSLEIGNPNSPLKRGNCCKEPESNQRTQDPSELKGSQGLGNNIWSPREKKKETKTGFYLAFLLVQRGTSILSNPHVPPKTWKDPKTGRLPNVNSLSAQDNNMLCNFMRPFGSSKHQRKRCSSLWRKK